MGALGRIGLLVAGGAVAVWVARHRHHRGGSRRPRGHRPPGDVLIDDARVYDRIARLLFAPFVTGVAADVAAAAPQDARVLDVGCGPGHLSCALAGRYGFDVTGVDLDPAMIARARANADAVRAQGAAPQPTFLVGDAASLPLPDASFDVVVSTLAMHHWADPARGLAEIGRVLRADGLALVWDLRAHAARAHRAVPDPTDHTTGSGLRVVSATPWKWPWRFALTTRVEMVRADH